MISCVIFDMDGVIIDSEPIYMKVEQDLFKEVGLELSHEEHATFVGRSDLWKVLKEKYKLDINIQEIHKKENERYLDIIKNSFDDSPIKGVVDVIEELHHNNIMLALASSSEMKNIELVLTKFGLLNYFNLRISGADLETSKPHPEIFEKAAKMAKKSPENCLVIEDSANGVRAAKAAGMQCIGFKNPNSGNQDLSPADWIIHSFDEFDLEKFVG
ncbi:MAG: HAD-IA family hydrolase [Bacteroidetes bacterium]|jgi:HAD superfamily hydrolase (TIGR01509 family)|nr:HAD-IA family hydrolase [Bacteroidota bacterium]